MDSYQLESLANDFAAARKDVPFVEEGRLRELSNRIFAAVPEGKHG